MTFAAIAAATGMTGIALFQLALALGAPWGVAAWGGTIRGRLPARQRAASGAAMLIWLLAALTVLGKAGIGPLPPIAWLVWVVFGLLAAGTLLNLASRSPWERYFWAPYAFVTAILTFIVARG